MRAITLHDPWAQAVAHGLKSIETRGRTFPASYRGPLAIHSSKVPPNGVSAVEALAGPASSWPRGAVIALCTLEEVRTIVVIRGGRGPAAGLPRSLGIAALPEDIVLVGGEPVSDAERVWGFWASGRKALMLTDVRALDVPVPARGMLGLWEWHESRGGAHK